MENMQLLVDLSKLTDGERIEMTKLGMLTDTNTIQNYSYPAVHDERPPIEKFAVHAPNVINEAYDYKKINFLRARGRVVYVCSDQGLSTFDGTTWITYKKDENSQNGKAIITTGAEISEVPMVPSIAHNFVIGVDAKDDEIWIATSKGVSRGELLK